MNKAVKLILWLAGTVIALFILALIALNVFFRINYREFYASSQKEFKIPGLSSGFTPQGLTRCADGTFLSCGYMKDGSASRIYIINDKNVYVSLAKKDGSPDNNHAGGLAVYEDYIYLTNEEYISVYKLDDVLKASAGDKVSPVMQLYTSFKSAFVYVKDNKMYAGEFYRKENYMTETSHHMKTDSGDMHYAIMAVYSLSKDGVYGLVSKVPERVYSITGLAQGICITDSGEICVSTSYGTASSNIFIYEDPAVKAPDGKFLINGEQVPLYYLDKNHLKKTVKLFPMSEELVYSNGRIYIMCESACNKYVFGKFTGNDYLYSYKYS